MAGSFHRYHAVTGNDMIQIGDAFAVLSGRKANATGVRRILANCPTDLCTVTVAGKLATPYISSNSKLAADKIGYLGIRVRRDDALGLLRGVRTRQQFLAAMRTMTSFYDWSDVYQVTVLGNLHPDTGPARPSGQGLF